MKISSELDDAEQYKVYDCNGSMIPYVVSFDTETCELEVAIPVGFEEGTEDQPERRTKFLQELDRQGKPREVILLFRVPGAYATYKNAIVSSSN